MFKVEVYQNILKLSCWPLAFAFHKVFLKNKMRSRTSLPASLSASFLKKNISHVIFYQLTKFHCLIVFLRYWAICVLQLFVVQSVNKIKLKFLRKYYHCLGCGKKTTPAPTKQIIKLVLLIMEIIEIEIIGWINPRSRSIRLSSRAFTF